MHGRQARGGGLNRLARFEQRLEADAVAAQEQLHRARNRLVSGAPDDRSAIAPRPRFDEAFDFEDPKRLAHRGPAQARLRHQFALSWEWRSFSVAAAQNVLA